MFFVEANCPAFDKVQAEIDSDTDNCDQGIRKVEFSAQPTLSDCVVQFIATSLSSGLQFNGAAIQTVAGQTFSSVLPLPHDDDFHFALQVFAPSGCLGPTGFIHVPACPEQPTPPNRCPDVDIETTVDEKCDANGRRLVTVKATVKPKGSPVSASLQIDATTSGAVGIHETLQSIARQSQRFDLQGARALSPGSYKALVVVTSPTGCGDAAEIFTVEACDSAPSTKPKPTPPPASTPASNVDECVIWFWINVVLIAVTGALIFIILCFLSVSGIALIILGGLILITLASFLAWIWLCAFGEMGAEKCQLLETLELILTTLAGLSAAVAVIIWLAKGLCFGVAIVDVGWFAMLLMITVVVANLVGCHLKE